MATHAKLLTIVLICVGTLGTGCAARTMNQQPDAIAASNIPRELEKVSHPVYRVAPPDILSIEAVNSIRLANAPLDVGDEVFVRLGNPEPLAPEQPGLGLLEQQLKTTFEAQTKFIDSDFRIQSDGTINLGPVYGQIRIEGLTVDAAQKAVRDHLTTYAKDEDGKPFGIKNPQVTVTLPNVTGKQAVTGEHLVRQDGTLALGIYGSVHVAGQTLDEVKRTVERHLSQFLHNPEISVDVAAYNSKVYYVITDGGGYGERVEKLPITGNETVLDAISNIQGLSQVSSKRIWVARPAPAGTMHAQVMDVNWREITQEGITTTNYQLLPGDRVYIAADNWIATDNFIGKIIAPFERIMGIILLGQGTQNALRFGHINNLGGRQQ